MTGNVPTSAAIAAWISSNGRCCPAVRYARPVAPMPAAFARCGARNSRARRAASVPVCSQIHCAWLALWTIKLQEEQKESKTRVVKRQQTHMQAVQISSHGFEYSMTAVSPNSLPVAVLEHAVCNEARRRQPRGHALHAARRAHDQVRHGGAVSVGGLVG